MEPRRYTATPEVGGRGRLTVPVPFDPDEVWGRKAAHHVAGTVGGVRVRATVEVVGGRWVIALGPAWRRDCGVEPGATVEVVLAPEGPQRGDLAEDVAAALDASPSAGAFFDSLAQFYRRAYLRWIDATKRRPQERERRIAVVVALLEQGVKQRPGPGASAG
ncbi:YdeI/OmpD-associated family protein [Pseudonocardia sp.]|uniref:YdeI/OmpD-associated family protein n=1 Tax=Pseudonocardia sp. TaxID=60912 RepID=UPI00262E3FC9|nr:YdeI/OmpD-associated family protein [Pseudonocardia sp.]